MSLRTLNLGADQLRLALRLRRGCWLTRLLLLRADDVEVESAARSPRAFESRHDKFWRLLPRIVAYLDGVVGRLRLPGVKDVLLGLPEGVEDGLNRLGGQDSQPRSQAHELPRPRYLRFLVDRRVVYQDRDRVVPLHQDIH